MANKAVGGASLKVMAEDKANGAVSKSLPTFGVDPRVINVREGFNGRPINRDHLDAMKAVWVAASESDHPHNPFPPITLKVENGEMFVVAGHHRRAMYLELITAGYEISKVPAVEFKGNEVEQTFFMLGENDGLGWAPMELGAKYGYLVNSCGLSFIEVAERRGKSVQHVKDCIRLLEQPEEIKAAIQAGTVAPATALKLSKKVGAADAARMIKDAGVLAPTKKITQKDIDNLGRTMVDAAATRALTAKDHLTAMMESPSVPKLVKAAVRTVVKFLGGDVSGDEKPAETPDSYLSSIINDKNDTVRMAADVLVKHRSGKRLPDNLGGEAKAYQNHMWMMELAADVKRPALRGAAHWFLAMLESNRAGREPAPIPSLMSLEEAVRIEIDSDGAARAEDMAPDHAELIKYLRGAR